MLNRICPTRPGSDSDAVDGTVPGYVATPGSVDEASEVMRIATSHELRVVPRGAATKLGRGNPPRACDLVIDVSRMDQVLEHASGDLVARVQAGLPLARLQEVLAVAGQQLALDEPAPGSTIGGMLATAASGPRRLLYGTPRDLVIGVTAIRPDGTVARSGGKVVKNVAGYDLGKLYTGSYGTLGLIVEVAFRLHPRPASSAVVSATATDARAAHARVQDLLHSQLVPAAIEIDRPNPRSPITVAALFEGEPQGVEARCATTRRLLGEGAVATRATPPWWGHFPAGEGAVVIKVSARIAALAEVLDAVAEAGEQTDPGWLAPAVRGSAGTGVLHVGLPARAPAPSVARFLDRLREAVSAHDGSAVIVGAPREVRAATDVWGPVRGLSLMRRVKDQFDPEHRCSPGRFVGGI